MIYTKLYSVDYSSTGDTVYTAMEKLEGNIDQLVADLNACHLSTQGDMLYRGASSAQRLAIGSAGQVLKSTGSAPQWCTTFLHVDTTTVSQEGPATDATLMTYTLPANTLGSSGIIQISVVLERTGSGINCSFKFHFGSTSWTIQSGSTAMESVYRIVILNTSTSAQRGMMMANPGSSSGSDVYWTSSEDTTANVTIKVTTSPPSGVTAYQYIMLVEQLK